MNVTMQDRIAAGLRERILSGKLRPGERLRQEDVAQQFDASHIPVREALRQLSMEGLVSIQPHRGAVVTTLSRRELEEIIRLRQILEVELIGQAIPRMNPSDIARSRRLLDSLRNNRRAALYAPRNWAFHESLYLPANAPLTLGLVERLHQIGQRYFQLGQSFQEVNDEHQVLVELAANHDVDGAAKLLHHHIGQLRRLSIPQP